MQALLLSLLSSFQKLNSSVRGHEMKNAIAQVLRVVRSIAVKCSCESGSLFMRLNADQEVKL